MTLDKTPAVIQTMFNMISDKYDLVNNLMSFGMQKIIKKRCVKLLGVKSDDAVADLCCGTGDFAQLIKNCMSNNKDFVPNIIGIDFSENMIKIAKEKVKGVKFFLGDVTALPFPDETFDIATMGFGLRNIHNPERAVEEVFRILKPGGKFMHLDFGEKNFLSAIFDKFVLFFIKFFNDYAYRYLIESKRMFLTPVELIRDFESKGFRLYKRKDFLFGAISCQIMEKC